MRAVRASVGPYFFCAIIERDVDRPQIADQALDVEALVGGERPPEALWRSQTERRVALGGRAGARRDADCRDEAMSSVERARPDSTTAPLPLPFK